MSTATYVTWQNYTTAVQQPKLIGAMRLDAINDEEFWKMSYYQPDNERKRLCEPRFRNGKTYWQLVLSDAPKGFLREFQRAEPEHVIVADTVQQIVDVLQRNFPPPSEFDAARSMVSCVGTSKVFSGDGQWRWEKQGRPFGFFTTPTPGIVLGTDNADDTTDELRALVERATRVGPHSALRIVRTYLASIGELVEKQQELLGVSPTLKFFRGEDDDWLYSTFDPKSALTQQRRYISMANRAKTAATKKPTQQLDGFLPVWVVQAAFRSLRNELIGTYAFKYRDLDLYTRRRSDVVEALGVILRVHTQWFGKYQYRRCDDFCRMLLCYHRRRRVTASHWRTFPSFLDFLETELRSLFGKTLVREYKNSNGKESQAVEYAQKHVRKSTYSPASPLFDPKESGNAPKYDYEARQAEKRAAAEASKEKLEGIRKRAKARAAEEKTSIPFDGTSDTITIEEENREAADAISGCQEEVGAAG